MSQWKVDAREPENLVAYFEALNDTSDNATQNFLLYQYIQMLKDPDSNVKFVVVPVNGTPLILDTTGEQK